MLYGVDAVESERNKWSDISDILSSSSREAGTFSGGVTVTVKVLNTLLLSRDDDDHDEDVMSSCGFGDGDVITAVEFGQKYPHCHAVTLMIQSGEREGWEKVYVWYEGEKHSPANHDELVKQAFNCHCGEGAVRYPDDPDDEDSNDPILRAMRSLLIAHKNSDAITCSVIQEAIDKRLKELNND